MDRLALLREIRRIDKKLEEINYHTIPVRNSPRRYQIIFLLAERTYYQNQLEKLIS